MQEVVTQLFSYKVWFEESYMLIVNKCSADNHCVQHMVKSLHFLQATLIKRAFTVYEH